MGWVSRFARIWGWILNAYNSETVRARPAIWYFFLLKWVRVIEWNTFGDDRAKDNEVSALDHVVWQGRMGNYWDR